MMSSVAAHASARPPVSVRCMRRSVRIRASTGNAVIDIAAPMNSANGQKSTPSGLRPAVASVSTKIFASPMPRLKGSTIEQTDTEPATFPRPLTRETSSSRPTTNMKSTRPTRARTSRKGRWSIGKSCSLSSMPSRLGPSSTPAAISPTTGGIPIFDTRKPAVLATTMISASRARITAKSMTGPGTGAASEMTCDMERLLGMIRPRQPIAVCPPCGAPMRQESASGITSQRSDLRRASRARPGAGRRTCRHRPRSGPPAHRPRRSGRAPSRSPGRRSRPSRAGGR